MKIVSRVVAVALAAAGLMLVPTAHAQWLLKQDTGLYIGAAAGQSKVRNFCNDVAASGFPSCDEKDVTWKLSAGYNFSRNFAVEAGYVDWGKFTFGNAVVSGNVKARGFELLAVGIFPVYQNLSAYGKLGFVRWDADFGARAGSAAVTADEKGTEFTFGFGLSYDFTNNIAARLEWQRYADLIVDTLSLGVVYKFR